MVLEYTEGLTLEHITRPIELNTIIVTVTVFQGLVRVMVA